MKIKNLFLSGLACLAMTACSNNDEPAVDNGLNINEGDKHFLAVSISNSNSSCARAATDGGYESGYDNNVDEGKITNVRFYLFKEGNVRNISEGVNYIDATVETDPTQSDYNTDNVESGKAMATEGNIESQLSAVLVINGEKDNLPDGIIAIANPNRANLGNESKTIAQLQEISGEYDIEEYIGTESKFLMSNSVFVNNSNVQIATPITPTNYAETAEGAKGKPVEMYIERVVAKVRVKFGSSFTPITNDANETIGYRLAINETQTHDTNTKIYAEVLGWGLTKTRTSSNLLKSLTTDYSNFNWTWNDPTNNRSYWANTTTENNAVQDPNAWKNSKDATNLVGNLNSLYCQENTASEFTQAVFAVQLKKAVTSEGKTTYEPLTIYQYAGQNWTLEELAKNIGFTANVYVKTTTTGEGDATTTPTSYSNNISEYIEFKAEDQDNQTRYKSYPILKESNTDVTFAKKNENGEYEDYTDNTAVNTALAEISVNVWNQGKAYYHIPIEHFANSNADTPYGIVRNHIYEITVNNITGFGTPVNDETLIIKTEKPNDTNTYIAARINVLSWRVVKQEVGLQ